MASTHI